MTQLGMHPAGARRFQSGLVIARSLAILGQNFAAFVLIAGLVTLPNLLVEESADDSLGWAILAFIVSSILAYAAQGFLAHGAYQAAAGRSFGAGDTLRVAAGRFFPLIALAGWVGLLVALGFVLLIVPGAMFLVMWSVAVPACVVEGSSPFASMRRSAELTRGHRWTLFGLFLLLFVGVAMALIIVDLALAQIDNPAFAAFGSWLARAVVAAFQAVIAVVAYHDLRAAKEATRPPFAALAAGR